METAAIRGNLPNAGAILVDQGETQPSSNGRPAWPGNSSGQTRQLARLTPVSLCEVDILARRKRQPFSVRRPGRVSSQQVAQSPRGASQNRQSPSGAPLWHETGSQHEKLRSILRYANGN